MASKPNRSTHTTEPAVNKKTSPATPSRISKLGRASPKTESDLLSPLQNSSRLSIERPPSRSAGFKPSLDTSPKSVPTKPLIDRRSPRLATPPEKIHAAKEHENQVKLNDIQEELKNAKEQLALVENEKAQVIRELKDVQKLVDAANEKLSEALLAQKRAEEDSEIEEFQALEIEQVGTEITQKKEEEWMKEIETIKEQHTLDLAALLSTTLELQHVKEELSMISDAKNQAMRHADDATKIAELHAEKAENLSLEVNKLKALLDWKVESEAITSRMVTELKSEVEVLNKELKKTLTLNGTIAKQDVTLENISMELEAARMAEAYAYSLVNECNDQIGSLIEETSQSKKRASEALYTASKQLEDNKTLLRDSESNISLLKDKINLLEVSLEKQKEAIEEFKQRTVASREEVIGLSQTVKSLTSELHITQEEKLQALGNEKLAASVIEKLVEEKNRLLRDLEVAKEEDEKIKKAMETLAEALHEVSSEAKEAKEDLQLSQAENMKLVNQIKDLNNAIKVAEENYESDANHEVNVLIRKLEQSNDAFKDSKAEWAQKEDRFAENLKILENEKLSADTKLQRLEKALKEAAGEALSEKEEANRLSGLLKKAESEAIHLRAFLGETKAESVRLEETLLDKEAELKIAIQKTENLQNQEAGYQCKIEELSRLLQVASVKKMTGENDHLSDSDKECDLLPKVVTFSADNGNMKSREAAIKIDFPSPETHNYKKFEKMNGTDDPPNENSPTRSDSTDHENHREDLHDVDDKRKFMVWESCKIDEKDHSPSRETKQELFDEKVDSKWEGNDSFDQIAESTESLDNGSTPPFKRPKKIKPLLRKFGSLLKKKGSPSLEK